MFLTVIVRVFNREDTIKRCLESLLGQSLINEIQILIINDCSTDNSMNIINSIIKENPSILFTIVNHEKNYGRGKALNTSKKYIVGKYCCVLDSDDAYIRSTWVEELKEEIGNKEYDILYNGDKDALHVNNIYLSDMFKNAPIANLNYYEDHYTKWFFLNCFRIHKYNIKKFYQINKDSNDRKDNSHAKEMLKQYNEKLKVLYENVFYSNKFSMDDLKKQFLNFNHTNLTGKKEILIESYNEIKNFLKI